MLRRQALVAAGGLDSTLPAGYDLDAWLRIALLRSNNSWAIPEFLTSYRRRGGQILVRDDQRGLGIIIPTMFQTRLHQAVARAVSDAWLSEHPDGRKRDANMLSEPGSAFGMPDLPTLIPSDDRAS